MLNYPPVVVVVVGGFPSEESKQSLEEMQLFCVPFNWTECIGGDISFFLHLTPFREEGKKSHRQFGREQFLGVIWLCQHAEQHHRRCCHFFAHTICKWGGVGHFFLQAICLRRQIRSRADDNYPPESSSTVCTVGLQYEVCGLCLVESYLFYPGGNLWKFFALLRTGTEEHILILLRGFRCMLRVWLKRHSWRSHLRNDQERYGTILSPISLSPMHEKLLLPPPRPKLSGAWNLICQREHFSFMSTHKDNGK